MLGGIVGLQDKNAGIGLVGGCFSNFQLSRLWCDGDTMARIIDNNNSESLIHGGTNDRNRNLKGTRVDNADGFVYTDYVHQCVMEGLYAKDASALNTAYYADANVKLVKQIHTEHPAAKIVFVIGDRLKLAMVDVLIQIADHYNNFCSYVDFRTPGYDNLSKFSGSHPTAAGHGKMAKQIYSEVGTWMETE